MNVTDARLMTPASAGANVAVELAFRRYLSKMNIPFDIKAATPFTDRERL
jgi:hypothetical protein